MINSDEATEKDTKKLLEIISSQSEKISLQEQTIKHLVEQLKLGRHQRFAKSSEKDAESGQKSLFDEADIKNDASCEEQTEAEAEIAVAPYTRKKSGRKPIPEKYPRIERVYDLPESEKQCACGCQLVCIGEERSEQIDIIPAKIQVIVHVRKKHACKFGCQQVVKLAPMPKLPIPKSIATSATLAHVLTAKFEDYLPLYRQEKIFQRLGVDIPRSTLSHWVLRAGDLLKPLVNLIQSNILEYDVAYADETTVQVLKEPDRPPDAKSYMWLFMGGEPGKRGCVYRYAPTRAHEVPLQFFDGFEGYLHCDGFSAYDTLSRKCNITLVGCWYHARRKFIEASRVSNKPGLAKQAINIIKKLSQIEKDIQRLNGTPEKAKQIRELRAAPIIKKFKSWLETHANQAPKESLIGKAIHYTLSQWHKLINYLQDGRLEISNNRTERGIKPFVMGRKNWMFANSVNGADAAGVIYSLIETCKLHDIQPYDYLRYVLEIIPEAQTLEQFEALLPYHCKEVIKSR